jgi:hypothetical protein
MKNKLLKISDIKNRSNNECTKLPILKEKLFKYEVSVQKLI